MSAIDHSNKLYDTDTSRFETQLFPSRWILIGCIFLQNGLFGISLYAFGLNNDIFSAYFDASYAEIDWFTIINKPAKWLTCICLAFLSITYKSGFRKVSIFTSFLTLLGSLLQFISYLYPEFYFLLYIGNFLLGVVGGVLLVIPISFAVLWFSDEEIGSALSIKTAGGRLGFLIACLVPSHLLTSFNDKESNIIPTFDNTSSHYSPQVKHAWLDDQRKKMLIYQGAIVAAAAVTLIFLIKFAMDQPPKPPTQAQARLRLIEEKQDEIEAWQKLKQFAGETKSLFSDVTIPLLVIVVSIIYATSAYQTLFLGEIMRPIFRMYFKDLKADAISSYLIVAFQVAAFLSTIGVGLLVDRIKRYVLLVRIGFVLSVLSSTGLAISYYYSNVSAIFVTNVLLGMSAPAIATPLFELSTQHTYPRKTQFVLACLTSGFILVEVVLIEIGRTLINRTGNLSLLIYQALLFLFALLLTLVIKPKYRRLEEEMKKDKKNQQESAPFLNHSDG